METQNDKKSTILIVDDTPDNIALLSSLLKSTYRTKAATTGEKALQLAGSGAPLPASRRTGKTP